MLKKNQESIQLLNTAIIKNKEKRIDSKFEERLANTCEAPAMEALGLAITHLSNDLSISRDQAAILIIDTIKELESSWNDYLLMEGIEKIKENLKN